MGKNLYTSYSIGSSCQRIIMKAEDVGTTLTYAYLENKYSCDCTGCGTMGGGTAVCLFSLAASFDVGGGKILFVLLLRSFLVWTEWKCCANNDFGLPRLPSLFGYHLKVHL